MRHTITVAICVIVSLVLGAIATRYVHPHWLLSILHSLQLHAAAACIVAMIVALVIRRHFLVWLIFAASVALTGHAVVMNYEFGQPATSRTPDAPTFKMLSFNIFTDNFANSDALTRTILSSGADLVNIMEAGPLRRNLDELAKTYPYRVGCGVMMQECDQLMLSKFPLVAPVVRNLSEIFPNRSITARMMIAGTEINFVTLHTTKPYFDNFHSMELYHAGMTINRQVGPLVVAGDFNASSLAPNMRRFLQATGMKTVGWEPATWPIRAGAFGLPIDHVFVRPPLRIKSLTRLPDPIGSNHYGLMAEIAVTGN